MFWRTSNNFNFVLYKFINGVKDNAKYNVYFGCVFNIIYLQMNVFADVPREFGDSVTDV